MPRKRHGGITSKKKKRLKRSYSSRCLQISLHKIYQKGQPANNYDDSKPWPNMATILDCICLDFMGLVTKNQEPVIDVVYLKKIDS